MTFAHPASRWSPRRSSSFRWCGSSGMSTGRPAARRRPAIRRAGDAAAAERLLKPGYAVRLKCEAILGIAALLFSGCYGDFGRPRGPLFGDNRAWSLGDQAAYALGQPSSAYPLSDQEVLMRDLAFNI